MSRLAFRRILAILVRLAFAFVLLVLIAFFLVTDALVDDPILGSAEARETERALAAAAQSFTPGAVGSLRVGWGSAPITPPLGTPTWGYLERLGRGTEGVADEVFVHALALAAGGESACVFLSGDLCLWPSGLSGRIAKALEGRVPRERLYFGATHTHNGPGGLAGGPLVELAMGGYHEDVFLQVVEASVHAVSTALDALAPGAYREHVSTAPDLVANRVQPGDPIDDEVVLLELARLDDRFALVVFDAHATTIGDVVTSGDYPGALVRELRTRGFDGAMFLAGATGQAGPRLEGRGAFAPGTDAAYRLGGLLAERLAAAAAASDAPFRESVSLSVFRCEVRLPPRRYRRFGRILDPALGGWLIGQPEPVAHVHALRLGDTVFLGHSFEFSAVIARRLEQRARERGGRLVLTSFNGDHNFYVVPPDYYAEPGFESRLSLFGSGLGPYLERISEQVFDFMVAADGEARSISFSLGGD